MPSDGHQDDLVKVLLYLNLLERGHLWLLHRFRLREGEWRSAEVLTHDRVSPALLAWSSHSRGVC